jgi:hypothetical protein
MVASLRKSVSTGTKEDETNIWRVSAAGFHHVTARSRLAQFLKLMNRLFLEFYTFLSGRGEPRIIETADTESTDIRGF